VPSKSCHLTGERTAMTDLLGSIHFLALLGFTGAWIEARIEPLPSWTALPALLAFSVVVVVYAGLIAWAYS